MASRAKKITSEKTVQRVHLNPLEAVFWVLSSIGRPFYFLLTNLILGIVFSLYFIGHSVRGVFRFIFKPRKLNLPKINLPQIKVPSFSISKIKFIKIRILRLRVSLFELKLLSKIGNVFRKRKITKRKFRFRLIYILPVFFIVLIFLFWLVILKDLPSPKNLTDRPIEVST